MYVLRMYVHVFWNVSYNITQVSDKRSFLLSDSEVYYSAVDPNFQKKDYSGEDFRIAKKREINLEQLKVQISII